MLDKTIKKGEIMTQIRGVFTGLILLAALAGLVLVGSAWAQDEGFPCKPDVTVADDATGKAELEEFSCFFKKWEGVKTLHFKVGVKNPSDTPQRYKVHIFLENGKAVGGLIPRKTKKGLVEPGQSASFVYPVKAMAEKPNEIMVKISTVSQ